MMLTYGMVSKAEDMTECFEDAMSSIKSAIEVLRNSRDDAAADFADDLESMLLSIKEENEQYEEIVAEDRRQGELALTREYWRAVI